MIYADITWDDVEDFAPELASGVADGAQTAILDYVNNEALDAVNLGGETARKYWLGRLYLACHMGTLAPKRAGAAGPVTSSSAGRLSRSFGVVASGDSSTWGLTSYGSLLKGLLATTGARVGTARGA